MGRHIWHDMAYMERLGQREGMTKRGGLANLHASRRRGGKSGHSEELPRSVDDPQC